MLALSLSFLGASAEDSSTLPLSRTYAICCALGIFFATVLAYAGYRSAVSSQRHKGHSTGPLALIIVSDDEFEVPCVAVAATALKSCGLEFKLASRSGRSTRPDKRSLEQPESKRAAAREDPVWLSVFELAQKGPTALARVSAHDADLLFIAGGPRMLADLRDTDLRGATPSPFCLALQRLAADVHAAGGVIGAVGHGVRGLPSAADLQGADGERRFVGRLDSSAEETVRDMLAARAASMATRPPGA